MIDIKVFMLRSREERRSHLDLSSECIERGGNSFQMRGLLAHILNTTIPPPRNGRMIVVCHACHNALCGNPYHIYWGNNSDNRIDSIENGGAANAYYHALNRHGEEYARKMNSRSRLSAAKSGKGNLGKTKTPEHRAKISASIKLSHERRISGMVGISRVELE
jgi:hypothetical protein